MCFEGGFFLWALHLKKKDGGGRCRLNFSHFSVISVTFPTHFLLGSFFKQQADLLMDLKGRWTQILFCALVQKENRKHVCSTSGNRQLYLSQLSYKLGKIVTFNTFTTVSREFNTVCMKIWVHNNNCLSDGVSFFVVVVATKVKNFFKKKHFKKRFLKKTVISGFICSNTGELAESFRFSTRNYRWYFRDEKPQALGSVPTGTF